MQAPKTMSRERFVERINRSYDSYFNGEYALAYLHIVNLKHYNRIHGISSGDAVLHDVIDLLGRRATDQLIARYAGDGLTFIIPFGIVSTVANEVNAMLPTFGEVYGLETKMGAIRCTSIMNVDECQRRANFACNSIRETPRRYVCLFEGDVETEFNKRLYVIDHLDDAIANGEIEAWAQPIVRVLTGKLCEVEILARWKSKEYGFLLPDEFVPILEQYQLIHKLDLEVIRLACAHWAEAKALGLQVPFGINLSRMDFELCDIYTNIRNCMRTYGVPVDQLHVEITESSAIQDNDILDEGVRRFRDAGFLVYMDDFGSGYSSLGQMANLNFDVIKIDKGLIDHVPSNERSRAVLADTVALVKRLGMQTLCEGVEDEEQLEFLRAVGCEKAQGFLFGPPADHSSTMERLKERMLLHEDAAENAYLDAVGQVNLIDCTSAGIHGVEASAFLGRSPAAVLEIEGSTIRQLNCNFAFMHLFERMGFASFDDMAQSGTSTTNRIVARSIGTGKISRQSGKTETFDFIAGGVFCSATMLYVARTGNREAYLSTITSIENSPQVTEHTLLAGVLETSNLCFFWKDTDRRFLGANQRFYDYYGFAGLEDILGKTDEDMGWHLDDLPYYHDEVRVLKGEVVSRSPGVCLCRGEYRDIIATKRPLYSHGAIVGLVGFFEDVGPHKA